MGRDKKQMYKKENSKKEKEKKEPKPSNKENNFGGAAAVGGGTASGPGCICPVGCLVGKEITINDAVGVRAAGGNQQQKLIKVFCSNAAKCKSIPFMHEICFDKWEELLMKTLRVRRITRDWNDDKLKHHLWLNDGDSYTHRGRKCSCGGFLTRVEPEDEVLPKPTEKAEKNAIKAATESEAAGKKKQLPELVTIATKLGGTSLYKSCPGYAANGIAASYSSHDYMDRSNRTRNRPSTDEWKKRLQAKKDKKGGESDDDEDGSGNGWLPKRAQTRSRTTSMSSSVDEWGAPRAESNFYLGAWMPSSGMWRPNSASGKNGGRAEERQSGRKMEFEMPNTDFEEAKDEFDTEEKLLGEIRDLLGSLGGQLELDDQLLTGIVGRASGDLMMVIVDMGGLGSWLSSHPEFDVDNGRVRLCRNVKRAPARLHTSGVVQSITDNGGTIGCPSYDCMVYFEKNVQGANDLRKGDIIQFEAGECRPLIDGHRWKASSIVLLQRESQSQPLLTAVRRSYEKDESKSPIAVEPIPIPIAIPDRSSPGHIRRRLFFDQEQSKSIDNGKSVDVDNLIDFEKVDNGDEPTVVESSGFWSTPVQVQENRSTEEEKEEEQENEKEEEEEGDAFDDMVRELTKKYMPSCGLANENAYGDALAMVKSWERSVQK